MSSLKMEKDYDIYMKILIIGSSGTGKTCMLTRFTENQFTESYISTIGVDFKIKTMEIDGLKVKILIFDTAGQERFKKISSLYYRGAQGVLFVYDITDRTSFDDINMWVGEINNNASDTINKMLVGNKLDLVRLRTVSTEQGEILAKEIGVKFAEISAKTGEGIQEMFMTFITDIKNRLVDESKTATINSPRYKNVVKLDKHQDGSSLCRSSDKSSLHKSDSKVSNSSFFSKSQKSNSNDNNGVYNTNHYSSSHSITNSFGNSSIYNLGSNYGSTDNINLEDNRDYEYKNHKCSC